MDNTESSGKEVRSDLIAALAHSSLLQELAHTCPDTPRFRRMLSTAEVLAFRTGAIIIRQGQRSDRIYFLVDGSVKVSKNGKPVCTLSRMGEVFGEIGVVTGATRSASVSAETLTTCLAVRPDPSGDEDAESNAAFMDALQHALLRLLVGRLQETTSQLVRAREDLDRAEAQIRILTRGVEAKEGEINQLRARLKHQQGFMHRAKDER